jgi:hypothetical protein
VVPEEACYKVSSGLNDLAPLSGLDIPGVYRASLVSDNGPASETPPPFHSDR